jgi:hypothetical protein
MLAKNIILLCGADFCEWDALRRVADVMRDASSLAYSAPKRKWTYETLGPEFKMLNHMLVFLGPMEKFQCIDPRDRILGLLGLLDQV